jgi:trehalose-phosphatase
MLARWMKEAWLLETHPKLNLQQFLDDLSRSRKSILLLDYDGTLAPFHVHRSRAFPYPGVSELLQDIAKTGRTRIVLITGRRAQDIVPLLRSFRLPEIVGAYALGRLKSDGAHAMPGLPENVAQALADAAQWLIELGFGDQAELKLGSVAVHWRGLEDSVATSLREKALLGWLPIADRAGLTLQHFDGGVEIQLPASNKGNAVEDLLAGEDSSTPVAFLGDDQADEHAFRILRNRGLSILIRPEWRETDADLWLQPPGELVDFLSQWLAACRRSR